jgi:cellulose synthase/poly-beta-1,6-N-acetylglucosamine synthase-like glycosyltransferase
VKKNLEWVKLLEVFLIFSVLPTIGFYFLSFISMTILWVVYYASLTVFALQSILSILYSASAISRRPYEKAPIAAHGEPLKTTFIVSAYLVREAAVIRATLINLLENVIRPREGIEVILAYNSPEFDPIELEMRELAYRWPELVLANAYKSQTKSENLNNILHASTGEIVVLLDADHLVEPDCISRAWRWLSAGYDVVQGRCRVRNGNVNLLTRLIEVEFEIIYGVMHPAKSFLFDSTLFGGSNGYWKKDVLRKIRFRPDMLTEDIDATARAVLQGYKFVHDRTIVSTEIAPESISHLWYQRKRWAQGWFQVSSKYQNDVLASKVLNVRKKFLWTSLFAWRIFYDLATHFLFPVVFAFWLRQRGVSLGMELYAFICAVLVIASGPIEALAAFPHAATQRRSILQYAAYAFCTFPYTLFKNEVQLVAIRDELLGRRDWVKVMRVPR